MKIYLCCMLIVSVLSKTKAEKPTDPTNDEILNAFTKNSVFEYNSHVLPPSDGPMRVSFHLKITVLEDLDVEKQILSTKMMWHHMWTDSRIPEFLEAMGVNRTERFFIPISQIWTPDTWPQWVSVKPDDSNDIMCAVYPEGRIYVEQHMMMNSYCKVDLDIQPGDKVNCTLKFGSRHYTGDELDFSNSSRITSNQDAYFVSRQWKLTGTFMTRKAVKYDCCPDTFVTQIVILELQKKTIFDY